MDDPNGTINELKIENGKLVYLPPSFSDFKIEVGTVTYKSPLVKGGQGRTARSIMAETFVAVGIGIILGALLMLAAWKGVL